MIDTVPQLNNCVAEGYRAGLPPKAGKSGPPPPCVIKFVSKDIRDVILKLKKDNNPPPPARRRKQPDGSGWWWSRISPLPPTASSRSWSPSRSLRRCGPSTATSVSPSQETRTRLSENSAHLSSATQRFWPSSTNRLAARLASASSTVFSTPSSSVKR